MSEARLRAEGLDGLRGLAAAAVVLLHVWMFSGAHQPEQSQSVDRVIGALGVSLMAFFVLSGFLIALPWLRHATGQGKAPPRLGAYGWRRFARIMPAYAACVFGSYLLMRAIEHPLAISAGELPAFLLFAQNQLETTTGQLNPPLWSLAVEAMFYVVMPLIGLALVFAARRAPRAGVPLLLGGLAAAGLAWAAYAYAANEPATLVNALPTYLPIFVCGIAVAWFVARGAKPAAWQRALLVAAGAALVYWNAWWHSGGTGTVGHVLRDLPAGVGFALIVAAIATGGLRWLGIGPLARLGAWSYGIYLWHMPVLYALRHWERWPESPWQAYAVVLSASVVLGAASWWVVERPAIAWAARRTRRGRPERGAPAPAPAPAADPRPMPVAVPALRIHRPQPARYATMATRELAPGRRAA